MKNINIFLCGIGGQGVVVAGKIISQVFYESSCNVKVTDVIGVGQRGGSVSTNIRIGEKVYAPLIKSGTLNYLIAFEQYEALRWKHLLDKEGIILVNNYICQPNTVREGLEDDINVEEHFKQLLNKKLVISCDEILKKKNLSNKYINVLLLGVFSTFFEIPEDVWIDKISENVRAEYLSTDIDVFKQGRKIGNSNL